MAILDRIRSPGFLNGVRAALPTVPGIFTFGVIAAVATIGAGFHPIVAVMFSLIVYAGTAQLVAVQMLTAGSPLPVILLAALIVNLRLLIYSLAFSTHFRAKSIGWRVTIACLLSDQSYALTSTRYAYRPEDPTNDDHFLGVSVTVWLTWQLGGLSGALLGATIPPHWSLEYTITLTFLAMAILSIRDRALAVAAVTGALLAVGLWDLPFRIGMIIAIGGGIAAGLATERIQAR